MERFKQLLIQLTEMLHKRKRIVLALSCLVVFMTTYLLILPAFTLEKDEAVKHGGIDIGTEASGDVSDEKLDSVTVDEDKAAVEPSGKKDTSDVKKTDKKAKADTAKDATSDPLIFEGEGFSVAVEDKAGTLPEKTSIEATELVENPIDGTKAERKAAAEEYRNYYEKALEAVNDEAKGETEKKISFVKFYDITLQSGNEAIQPEKPVNVTISYDKQQQKELKVEEEKDVRIIHFAQDEKTGEITAEIIDDKNVDVTLKKSRMTDTTFEAEGFSVYGIVYTVDFHWEADGKKFDFSIPGGGFISFSQLIEVLGIETEDTKSFVENVENITFSNPELLSVSKVDQDTTVGAIKDALDLDCEYSGELTKEQIDDINETEIEAGDWALISLKPFQTEETLTITMSNGDVFAINITDRAYGSSDRANVTVPNLNGLMTIDMFNYGPPSELDTMYNSYDHGNSVSGEGINSYSNLKFVGYGSTADQGGWQYNAFTGGTSVYQGIVNSTLTGGFPTLADGTGSLSYLFDGSPRAYNGDPTGAKSVDSNVQGLFYKANSDGSANANGSYYAYDSDRYYAYLNGNNIELYNTYKFNAQNYYGGIGVDPSVNGDGFSNKGIGFFPYTKPDDYYVCPHPSDTNWHLNWHNELRAHYDHQFGLSMSAQFEMPLADTNGKQTVDGNNMIFSFSGDDDMWVFIDDVLVLDIGGVHHPSSGYIDFTEGIVHLDNAVYSSSGINKNNATVKISDIFDAADAEWVTDGHSAHTIKVFYLERGGIYSNCKITFNLPLILGKGSASVVKKDADPDNTTNDGKLEGAIFGLWENSDCSGDPFMTRVSGENGICTFADLSVGDDLENLVYYLKEMQAPYGYKLDDAVYTMKLIPDPNDVSGYKRDAEGNYIFQLLDQNGTSVQILDQEPRLPYIDNELAEDIGLKVQKKWQSADNVDVYVDPPANMTAKFRIKRNRSYDVIELGEDNIHRVIASKEQEPDAAFNANNANLIELPNNGSQTPWDYVFDNLKTAEAGSVRLNGKSYPVQFYYDYYVVEEEPLDGYETIYLNGEGKEISEDDVQGLATNQADQSQTIINRELMDIPVEKTWPDYEDEEFTWTAKFQLDYRNVPLTGDPNDPTHNEENPPEATEWPVYEPVKFVTISKGDEEQKFFEDLPMYYTDPNGVTWRREYSVREVEYSVWRVDENGTKIEPPVVSKGTNGTTGFEYTLWYRQDAGEDNNGDGVINEDDYEISVENKLAHREVSREIDITIDKEWPTGSTLSGAKAKFKLKRYVVEEYRNYENVPNNASWVDITLKTGDGNDQTLRVPQGQDMYIRGYLKGGTKNQNITFSCTAGENITPYSYDNSDSINQKAFSISFTADTSKTIQLVSGADDVSGGRSGFHLSDTNSVLQAEEDRHFSKEFELNSSNNWHAVFEDLPFVEEVKMHDGLTATTFVYSYYFEEVECDPEGFYPTFTDSNGNVFLGDEDNRIVFDTGIKATNRPIGFDILKVDKNDNDIKLPNAEFKLRKLAEDPELHYPVPTDPGGTYNGTEIGTEETAPETGKATFSQLTPGYYELTEIHAPDGYILLADNAVYIKVEKSGEIKLLKKHEENETTTFVEAGSGEMVGNTTLASSVTAEGRTIAFTVRNEPGAALPHTGGIGTTIFYVLGTILILGCGIYLIFRRRIRS